MLAPSVGGLIIYQAYGNFYAMTDTDIAISQENGQNRTNTDTRTERAKPSFVFAYNCMKEWIVDPFTIASYDEKLIIVTIKPVPVSQAEKPPSITRSGNSPLTGTRGSDLYTIALQESSSPTLICFIAKASPTQAWLWHRHLSHLNFDTINLLSKNDIVNGLPKLKYVKDQLCSSCEMGKSKRSNFKTKIVPSSKGGLHSLHMDLCGPMWIEIINGKKYILVIVDDYSRYNWTHFMRSKDETPEVLIDFLKIIQRGLQAHVINVRTKRGT
nr:integrase, catalytic region, zinc finger, CCHC-type, peptidase aspartic, catalytic [Tanacetum cinerariifolium]